MPLSLKSRWTRLPRGYKGDGDYLSVHHPEEPDAKDDALDATALALFAASGGGMGGHPFMKTENPS